ncbi:MAG: aldehyde dehydrogenase family protein [Deltaproteobacteria bacterium]|nr:aldehyde dehydrogenase family protein [Deltaproteobacteria bacterium]
MTTEHILRVESPYTGQIVFERPLLDGAAVDPLMARAEKAQRAWRETSLAERIALVSRFASAFEVSAEVYAREISQSMGKPIAQARGEVRTMCARARALAEIAEAALADDVLPPIPGFERRIAHEPVGVVVVLAAWNYPLLIAVNPTVAAILAGNAVVLKHSARTPRVAEQFQEAFLAAGAPPDLVTAVHASHTVAKALVQHPKTGFVSFTGSVAGGRDIYRAVAETRFVDVTLELGGKDAAYVAADAPFAATVREVVDGAYYNAGQSCCGIERVYVHRSLYDAFLEEARTLIERYVLGDPDLESTTLGPMAQPGAPDFLRDQVEEAERLGARLILGGEKCAVDGRGRFFQPTLLADTDHRMAVAREESFGPVLAVAPVDDDDQALERMNDSPYGLTASIWTQDQDRVRRMGRRLEVGTVFMNRADFLDPLLAWTGWKDSGKGVSLSKLGLRAMTRPKSYHLKLSLS